MYEKLVSSQSSVVFRLPVLNFSVEYIERRQIKNNGQVTTDYGQNFHPRALRRKRLKVTG